MQLPDDVQDISTPILFICAESDAQVGRGGGGFCGGLRNVVGGLVVGGLRHSRTHVVDAKPPPALQKMFVSCARTLPDRTCLLFLLVHFFAVP